MRFGHSGSCGNCLISHGPTLLLYGRISESQVLQRPHGHHVEISAPAERLKKLLTRIEVAAAAERTAAESHRYDRKQGRVTFLSDMQASCGLRSPSRACGQFGARGLGQFDQRLDAVIGIDKLHDFERSRLSPQADGRIEVQDARQLGGGDGDFLLQGLLFGVQ